MVSGDALGLSCNTQQIYEGSVNTLQGAPNDLLINGQEHRLGLS